MLEKNSLRSCIILHHASKSIKYMMYELGWGVYYAAQFLMQKHTLESPHPRKVRETENCSKRINEKRKYLPSHFPVPEALKPAQKIFFPFLSALLLLCLASSGRANVRQW